MKFNTAIFLFLLLLCGCSMVVEPGGDCVISTDESETVTLSFQMVTAAHISGTRSDSQGHEETESEYKMLEDGIDVKDLGLFIFAKMAGSDSVEKLVLKITNITSSTMDPSMYIEGAPGGYTVSMVVTKDRLSEILGMDVNPNATGRVSFRVLMLANCNSPGTDDQAKWNQITGQTFSEVIGQLESWHYEMNYLYKGDGNSVTTIYGNRKKHIPMFGTAVFSVSQIDLFDSRIDRRIYLGELDMLRALAKVRVIDNIASKDENGYPKITSAEFIGSKQMACQLPLNALSYVNGTQVHEPNIYIDPNNPNDVLSLETRHSFRLGTVPGAWTDIPAANRKGDVRIGYVPEQRIGYINNNVGAGSMPIFRITVEFFDHSTKDYDVDMKSYNGQVFDFGENILRNHIYTLSVDEVESPGAELTLNFEVEEWLEQSLTLDYTETVTMEKLTWETDSYENYDSDTGELIVKPWYAGQSVPLKGKFNITTPVGAVWTARLIGNGTFRFKDGEMLTDSMSGYITDSSEEGGGLLPGLTSRDGFNLEIVTTIENPEQNYSAILQVTVTLPTGKVIEVDLTPDGTDYKNFTLIQNGD